MLAKEFRVPVVACVETYKFADVTRLDGLGSNEVLRKADANIRKGWEATGAQGDRRIGNGRESTWGREWAEEEGGKGEGKVEKEEAHLAKGGKKKGSLSSLALLYDLTPADYITAVCTEVCYLLSLGFDQPHADSLDRRDPIECASEV
jgi:translation initiation factor eIF-2B subunit delta